MLGFLSVALPIGMLGLPIGAAQPPKPFVLTVLHTNDCHARVEPARIRSDSYGGYSRLAFKSRQLLSTDPNPILLNAGDTFQGTLYFNVYEGLADLAIMNYMGYHAMAVGNHEFDRGPKPLGVFARGATFPLLSANIDVSAEPELKDWVRPSAVVTIGGQRIGLVGAVTPDLPTISSIGPNVRMLDLVPSVQREIDALAISGVDKVVLVTHVGYRDEIELVRRLRGVDLLVGGHSHSLLGVFDREGFPASSGPYPTVVKNADGDTALIVQAWEWGKVLGRIKVEFTDRGKVARWFDASPILIDARTPPDPVVEALIAALKKPIEALANEVVGSAEVAVGVPRESAFGSENTMGNVICDAMLEATIGMGVVAAFMNAGGIRSPIEAGPITYGEAISVQPFNNTILVLELTGAELRAALEHGVTRTGGFLHVSRGTAVRIDRSRPEGARIVSASVGGEPIEPDKVYKLAFNSFTAGGGDGHETLKNSKGRRTDTGLLDIDVLVDYLKRNRPLHPKLEGRISQVSGGSRTIERRQAA